MAHFDDFFGLFGRDLFDVHAPFGADHDNRPRQGAIEQDRAVKLLLDGGRRRDEDFAHQPAVRAGLFGDQHLAQHGGGLLENILRRAAKFDSALKAALKSPLAAAARVDLGLDRDQSFARGEDFFRGFFRVLRR